MVIDFLVFVLGVALLGLLVALLVSPLESLGWYAGWFGHRDELTRDVLAASGAPATHPGCDGGYPVVFLSGIGAISGEAHLEGELALVAGLRERLPDAAVIDEIFPYAAGGNALTSERFLAGVWRVLLALKTRTDGRGVGGIATKLVNVRNLMQVAVSADRRYGPVFNYGVSRQVVRAVVRAGYRPGRPVFLLGSSGGGQVALGVAPYVRMALGAPVEVIALGGVMSSDPGLDDVTMLSCIDGGNDRVPAVGRIVFPARWPVIPTSSWNRARREGRITSSTIPGVNHRGAGGYVDKHHVFDDGTSPLDRTVDAVTRVVTERLRHHPDGDREPADGC